MREELITLKNVSIVGVLTRGQIELLGANHCVIFLNAGLIHRIGPNRLYVKAARCLAAKGITCFRFDFSEREDSEVSKENLDQYDHQISEIKLAMDAVEKSTGIDHFFLIGICSGAETAFKASLTDDRIVGVSLINGVYQRGQILSRIYDMAALDNKIRYYRKHVLKIARWRKLLADGSNTFRISGLLILKFLADWSKRVMPKAIGKNKNTNKSNPLPEPSLYNIEEWENLFKRNVRIHVLFCEGGIAVDIFNITIAKLLRKYMYSDLFRLEFAKDVDALFTPIWSQDLFVSVISERVHKCL